MASSFDPIETAALAAAAWKGADPIGRGGVVEELLNKFGKENPDKTPAKVMASLKDSAPKDMFIPDGQRFSNATLARPLSVGEKVATIGQDKVNGRS
jgi:hypothetical protein